MIDRLLPSSFDNKYRGHRLALWLFVPITLQKFGVSLTHLLTADGGAQSISTIPLDTYPPSAAQNIIALFARMGLEQLLFASLLVLVSVRYRAMLPLMYVLIVSQYVGWRVVSEVEPLVLAGRSGASTPALVIAALSVIGLVLSLTGRGYSKQPEPG